MGIPAVNEDSVFSALLRQLVSYALSIHFRVLLCLPVHISRDQRAKNSFPCFLGSGNELGSTREIHCVKSQRHSLFSISSSDKKTHVLEQTGVFATARLKSCVLRYGIAMALTQLSATSWSQDHSYGAVIWKPGSSLLHFHFSSPSKE